ncbi:MAG: YCF48-related protein, partial [Methylocella sp.]
AQQSGTRNFLIGVHFADAQAGWAVGEEGTILATRDGGASWKAQQSGTGNRLYGVHFADAQTGWAVGEGGTILATRDGGASWKAQQSGTGNFLTGVHFADAQTGWAVGDGGTILATRDGGASWKAQQSGTHYTLHGVYFADAQSGWAVGGGGTMLRIAEFFFSPSVVDPTAKPTGVADEVDLSFQLAGDYAPIQKISAEARAGDAPWASIGKIVTSSPFDGRWHVTWQPSSFRIERGSPIEYHIIVDDGGPPLPPLSIGSFVFDPPKPLWDRFTERVLQLTAPQIAGAVAGLAILVWIVGLFLFHWLDPARLVKWHEALPEAAALEEASKALDKLSFGATAALVWVGKCLLLFLGTTTRALDAWVESRSGDARALFTARPTVRERSIALDLPVRINTLRRDEPWSELQRLLSKNVPLAMLISGPGGGGKTTLACRVGRRSLGTTDQPPLAGHTMLPLLVEADVIDEAAKPNGLYPYLAGLLRSALNEKRPISVSLTKALLRSGRVLVIVDGLSERSAATRQAFDPQRQDFEINRLIVTSRERGLPGMSANIETETIPTGALFDLIKRYLQEIERNGEGKSPSEDRILDACGDLKRLLGDAQCTPLLAAMWAKEIGAPPQEGISRPRGVASLMDSYVRRILLPATDGNESLVDRLTKDATRIAERELGERYQPGYITRSAALEVLRVCDPSDAAGRFRLLEKSRLLESPSQDSDAVRIAPDPVAEHLVARLRTEELASDLKGWRSFLAKIGKHGPPPGFVASLVAGAEHEVYGRSIPPLIRQQIRAFCDHGGGADAP